MENAVYQVPAPHGPAVVKVYPPQLRWKLHKEWHIYRILPDGIPVAEVLDVDAERGYIMFSALDGVPVHEATGDIRDIYRQMGGLLRRIHSVPMPGFGYLHTDVLNPVSSNVDYMTGRFEDKLREFTSLGGDPAVRRGIERAIDPGLFAACTEPVLCHNDFHEGNVLVHDGRVTGLVDMENALAGDPMLDIAKTWYYSIHGNRSKMDGLVEGYGMAPDPEVLAIYRIYHALELWDWFASIGTTAPLPGIMADLRRFTAAA